MKIKLKYLIPGILCLLLCLLCLLLMLPRKGDPVIEGGPPDRSSLTDNVSENPPPKDSSSADNEKNSSGNSGKTDQSSAGTSDDASSEKPPEKEPYVSPVDFTLLQNRCADIYAWLQIPGSYINYPVVQSPTDDSYYIKHTIDGEYSNNGALFTEHLYNGMDFDDPVTIIYGHHLRSGEMFGRLQEIYADEETFKSHKEIIVYLPDRELHYSTFAAVPYGKEHILYQYRSFRNEGALQAFLDSVYAVRGFGKNIDENCTVTEEDKLLVLSTCLDGNNQKRYLVIAKLTETIF